MSRNRVFILVAIAVATLSNIRLPAQEATPVEFPFSPGSPLQSGDLVATPESTRGDISIKSNSKDALKVRVRRGTMFTPGPGAGGQRVGVMSQLGSGIVLPGSSGISLPLEFLCAEAEKPDPTQGVRWQLQASLSPSLLEKQNYLVQLANGVDKVDAEVKQLASLVRLKKEQSSAVVDYKGPALSESSAHLLRVSDWSIGQDGNVSGVLNRAVVVQFAYWVLTDNYTSDDLGRRLCESRFAALQPREDSIRWSIQYVLTKAGFNPKLFDPMSPVVAYNRGTELLRNRNYKGAQEQFLRAIELRKDYATAMFNLALTFSMSGQLEPAKKTWKQVCELLPGDANSWYNLGAVSCRTGDLEGARICFDKALACNPKHVLAREWLPRLKPRL